MWGWFRKRKKKKEGVPEKQENATPELKEICADDPEAYEALFGPILLKPRVITMSMEEAVEKRDYFLAGQLALYRGDVEKVKEYFGKDTKFTDKTKGILEIPDRAVKKAQEYYAGLTPKKPKEE